MVIQTSIQTSHRLTTKVIKITSNRWAASNLKKLLKSHITITKNKKNLKPKQLLNKQLNLKQLQMNKLVYLACLSLLLKQQKPWKNIALYLWIKRKKLHKLWRKKWCQNQIQHHYLTLKDNLDLQFQRCSSMRLAKFTTTWKLQSVNWIPHSATFWNHSKVRIFIITLILIALNRFNDSFGRKVTDSFPSNHFYNKESL